MSEVLDKVVLRGRKVVGGLAEGEALVSHDTISGWGGIDAKAGTIIERRHELVGQSFKDKVLLFPGAKGVCLDYEIWNEEPTQSAVSFAGIALYGE